MSVLRRGLALVVVATLGWAGCAARGLSIVGGDAPGGSGASGGGGSGASGGGGGGNGHGGGGGSGGGGTGTGGNGNNGGGSSGCSMGGSAASTGAWVLAVVFAGVLGSRRRRPPRS
jgi:MYXO-CTERM domain-containing protein